MRRALAAVAVGLVLAPLLADAQPPTPHPRIGILATRRSPRIDAFREALRALGHVEGRTLAIEERFADDRIDRLPGLADELIRLRVDVIVAPDPPSAAAARKATRTVPIVMRSSDDPVAAGVVASLAHPGGNVTGVYSVAEELVAKRLELLREMLPHASRIAVLWDPDWPGSVRWFQEAEAAARALGIELRSTPVPQATGDFGRALRRAAEERAGALITLRNPAIVREHRSIVALAARHRLPAVYDDRQFAEAGGLASYGAHLTDLYRRLAVHVDRILKGTRPSELPVEQPTRSELVVNLRAARALGLAIPQSVLARADHVIE